MRRAPACSGVTTPGWQSEATPRYRSGATRAIQTSSPVPAPRRQATRPNCAARPRPTAWSPTTRTSSSTPSTCPSRKVDRREGACQMNKWHGPWPFRGLPLYPAGITPSGLGARRSERPPPPRGLRRRVTDRGKSVGSSNYGLIGQAGRTRRRRGRCGRRASPRGLAVGWCVCGTPFLARGRLAGRWARIWCAVASPSCLWTARSSMSAPCRPTGSPSAGSTRPLPCQLRRSRRMSFRTDSKRCCWPARHRRPRRRCAPLPTVWRPTGAWSRCRTGSTN